MLVEIERSDKIVTRREARNGGVRIESDRRKEGEK